MIAELSDRSHLYNSAQNQGVVSRHPARKGSKKDGKLGGKVAVGVFVILVVVFGSMHYYFSRYDPHNETLLGHKDHLVEISSSFSHDKVCYTQGFSFVNSTHILESCGLYRQSYMQLWELKSNIDGYELKLEQKVYFKQENVFIQGSVLFPKNNLIYVLTWQENLVYRYKIQSEGLKRVDTLKWGSQGWGLTHNRSHLIISDGSSQLYFVDENLKIQRRLVVVDSSNNEVTKINELQYVRENDKDYVYANQYLTSNILKIDLLTGKVVENYSFDFLIKKENNKNRQNVLNGIAYNPSMKYFLITGKKWEHVYQINNF